MKLRRTKQTVPFFGPPCMSRNCMHNFFLVSNKSMGNFPWLTWPVVTGQSLRGDDVSKNEGVQEYRYHL